MKFTSSIFASVLALGLSTGVQAASLGNVLLLGDSVTHASGGPDKEGYRYELWKQLVTNNDTFDFVGSNNTYFDQPTYTNYTPAAVNGITFDTDHEGHSGYTTSDIQAQLTTPWLNTYTPDTAVILLGFNDVLRYSQNGATNGGATDIVGRLESIISSIKTDNANTNIFVGTLYEYSFDDWDFSASNSNSRTAAEQETILTELNTQLNGSFANDNGVTVVDLNTGLIDPLDPTYLYDGLHPGQNAEEYIASQFYDAITGGAPTAVPAPAAVWLLGSALLGLIGTRRKKA